MKKIIFLALFLCASLTNAFSQVTSLVSGTAGVEIESPVLIEKGQVISLDTTIRIGFQPFALVYNAKSDSLFLYNPRDTSGLFNTALTVAAQLWQFNNNQEVPSDKYSFVLGPGQVVFVWSLDGKTTKFINFNRNDTIQIPPGSRMRDVVYEFANMLVNAGIERR